MRIASIISLLFNLAALSFFLMLLFAAFGARKFDLSSVLIVGLFTIPSLLNIFVISWHLKHRKQWQSGTWDSQPKTEGKALGPKNIPWYSQLRKQWQSRTWNSQHKNAQKALDPKSNIQTTSRKSWLTLFFKRKYLEISVYFRKKALDEQRKIDDIIKQRGFELEDWEAEFKKWCFDINPKFENKANNLNYLWNRYRSDFFAAQKAKRCIIEAESSGF